MKKYITLITLAVLLLIVHSIASVKASEIYIPELESHFITEDNYRYSNNEIVVLGNYHNISNSFLKNQISCLGNRVLIIYNVDLNNVVNKSDLEIYNSNLNIYYYNNDILVEKTIMTEYTNFDSFKEECLDYYFEVMIERNYKTNRITPQAVDTDLFKIQKTGTDRKLAAPYGYIDVSYTILK